MTLKTIGRPYKFIAVDSLKKEIQFHDVVESYSMGKLLIDFFEMKFEDYDQQRQEVLSVLADQQKFKTIVEENKDRYRVMREPKKYDSRKYSQEVLMHNLAGLDINISDEKAYVVNWLFRTLEEFNGKHPYFRVMDRGILGTISYQDLLELSFNLAGLQNLFKDAFQFCLYKGHDSQLEPLNATERFYIYNHMYGSPFEKLDINARVFYEPMTTGNTDKIKEGRSKNNLAVWVDHVKDNEISFTEHYFAYDIATLLYVEFFHMVKLNLQVDVCDNCSRFFVVEGLYNTKYCDRLDNNGRTCKTVGSSRKSKKKAGQDPIYRVYKAAYNRLLTRKKNGTITNERFDLIKTKIAELRRDVQEGKISFTDYEAEIERLCRILKFGRPRLP